MGGALPMPNGASVPGAGEAGRAGRRAKRPPGLRPPAHAPAASAPHSALNAEVTDLRRGLQFARGQTDPARCAEHRVTGYFPRAACLVLHHDHTTRFRGETPGTSSVVR